MSRQVEVERKFTVEPEALLPDLPGLAQVDAARDLQLVATYFDTPDLSLAGAGLTLRRRTGGDDDGWHLKVPAGGDRRVEIHVALTDSRSPLLVPESLRAEVDQVAAARPLIPVVELRTHRVERDLVAVPNGPVLGVLSDDTVSAVALDPHATSQRWREWEIELVTGTDRWLAEVADALVATDGVVVSHDSSKLARALGELPQPVPHTLESPASEVLLAWFATQVGVLQSRAPDIRRNAGDAVHKTRVATRRLRSALRTFAPLLNRDITDPLRAELKWYAAQLGGARDAEVLQARLLTAVDRLPPTLRDEAFVDHLADELARVHEQSLVDLVDAIDSPRYVGLQQDLVRLLTDPPLAAAAGRPAVEVLRQPVERARKKTLTWHQRSLEATGDDHWTARHETRKMAKAVRYAFELLAEAFPEAPDCAQAWERVTDSYGEVNDSVVARERLMELAEAAADHQESQFGYGLLYGQELEKSAASSRLSSIALIEANHPRYRRWLRD